MAEAPGAPQIAFTHPVPGGWGYRVNPPKKNLRALEDHLRAKFHPDLSSGLDLNREHINQHSPLCIG